MKQVYQPHKKIHPIHAFHAQVESIPQRVLTNVLFVHLDIIHHSNQVHASLVQQDFMPWKGDQNVSFVPQEPPQMQPQPSVCLVLQVIMLFQVWLNAEVVVQVNSRRKEHRFAWNVVLALFPMQRRLCVVRVLQVTMPFQVLIYVNHV